MGSLTSCSVAAANQERLNMDLDFLNMSDKEKVDAMVEFGIADDEDDARGQLEDMGELDDDGSLDGAAVKRECDNCDGAGCKECQPEFLFGKEGEDDDD